MKVWVIWDLDPLFGGVHAVFDSAEKAETFAEKAKRYRKYYSISELEVR